MFRVRDCVPFLIPLGLTILIWLTAWHDDLGLWNDVSRLIGLFLLGFALLAISLVLTVALRADPPTLSRREPTLRRDTEFRSGFATERRPGAARPRSAKISLHPRAGKVVAFRRHALPPQPRVAGALQSVETIVSLNRRLHDRAQKLWSRRAS